MIPIGKAVNYLRESLGLSLRRAANELGISFVHLCRIEHGDASPSPEILEKFRARWGIDVYMVAVCLFGDPNRFPPGVRGPMRSLRRAWEKQIAAAIAERRKNSEPACSTSKN